MYEITLIKEIFALVAHAAGGFVDPRESRYRVFVCGSLMDPGFVAGLLGHEVAMTPAAAPGFSRGWGEADGKKFHFLREDPGGLTPGVILLGLTDDDIEKLEEFEVVPDVRKRVDIEVIVGDIRLPGHTYIAKT